MADAMPGAAPAPTMEDFAAFEQLRQEVSPSEVNETLLATAAEADPMAVAEFKSELRDLELPAEVLDALDGMVDEILASPERYAEIRAHYLTQDMSEELLPETFDPEFFGALNIALDEIRATSDAPARAPQGFAKGGIASLGRNGDTMLAHVTPAEMRMLKAKGGAGTINPRTGLPEFFSLKKVFSKIGRAAKKFARSTVGKLVIGTALFMFAGPAAYGALGLGAGTAGAAAVSGFVAGAGSSLLAGENLKDSLKAGAIGGITAGAVKGVTNAVTGGAETVDVSESIGVDTADLVPETVTETVTETALAPTGLETTSLTDQLSLGTPTTPGIPAPPAGKIIRQDLMPSVDSGVNSLPVANTQSLASNNVPIIESAGIPGPNVTDPIGVPMQAVEPRSLYQRGLDKLMPSRIDAAGNIKADALADAAYDKAIAGGRSEAYAISNADAVRTAAQPGIISRFGPLAAAGVGVMGLAGGFDAPESEMPPGYADFMNTRGNPERYALNFGGVRPMGSSGYQTYTPAPYVPPPTYNAAKGSGPSGVAQEFPRMNGPINGPGTGTSDDVPAMLSDGEFVFTAKAVRNMGNGSRRKGAKKMYALMKKLEGTA